MDQALGVAVIAAVVAVVGATLHLGAGINIVVSRVVPLPIWTIAGFVAAMAGLRGAGLRWQHTPCPATLLLFAMIGGALWVAQRREQAARTRREAALEAERRRGEAALAALEAAGGASAPWSALRDALLVPADPALPGPVCEHDLKVLPWVRARLERERPARVDLRCACGQEGQAPAAHAGRKVACKGCGAALRIPPCDEDERIADLDELTGFLAQGKMYANVIERLRAHAAARE